MFAQVFKVAETKVNFDQMEQALAALGAPNWKTDTTNNAERLIEFAGRLCYKSFLPGLNPNVTKIREGNKQYLGNVLKQKHGSVFEHAYVSYAFIGVSRILTHEFVRHRVGIDFSQESQRFVRLDKFEIYIPDITPAFEEIANTTGQSDVREWAQQKQAQFLYAVHAFSNFGEERITQLISDFMLDMPNVSFHAKKVITSAIRRLLPAGVVTNILVTANHRTWRHILESRTSEGAEQEINEVMDFVGLRLIRDYPNIYQDSVIHYDEDYRVNHITFANTKI